MDAASATAAGPRKRSGRPPKLVAAGTTTRPDTSTETVSSPSDNAPSPTLHAIEHSGSSSSEPPLELDGSALAISPVSDEHGTPTAGGGALLAVGTAATVGSSECRRSSRKKIIKFDVRDLLNKNRKPHKIQIEARIDSNAPASPKVTTSAGAAGGTGALTAGNAAGGSTAATSVGSDLTSKQKTFFEKSAIFRRFSISEQQSKVAAPPLRPHPLSATAKLSLLGKQSGGEAGADSEALPALDAAKIAQARRLSRTQEIFNASLMKSKQNSSLIVAQMESSSSGSFASRATAAAAAKKGMLGRRRNAAKTSKPDEVSNVLQAAGTQKRRGRPPKNKAAMLAEEVLAGAAVAVKKSNVSDETASSAVQAKSKSEEAPAENSSKTITKGRLQKEAAAVRSTAMRETVALSTEKTRNWLQGSESSAAMTSTKRAAAATASTQRQQLPQEDVILEISSSSSMSAGSKQEFLSVESKRSTTRRADVNESQQRNFASVWFLQESANVNDNVNAPEFIVAAVEEIIAENSQEADGVERAADVAGSATSPAECADTSAPQREVIEIDKGVEKVASRTDTPPASELRAISVSGAITMPPAPVGKSSVSRTSSSSESETNSERSSKPYKQGDKLRVSLKRVAMPQSPTSSNSSAAPASGTSNDTAISRGSSNGNSSSSSVCSDSGAVKQKKKSAAAKRLRQEEPKLAKADCVEDYEEQSFKEKVQDADDKLTVNVVEEKLKQAEAPSAAQDVADQPAKVEQKAPETVEANIEAPTTSAASRVVTSAAIEFVEIIKNVEVELTERKRLTPKKQKSVVKLVKKEDDTVHVECIKSAEEGASKKETQKLSTSRDENNFEEKGDTTNVAKSDVDNLLKKPEEPEIVVNTIKSTESTEECVVEELKADVEPSKLSKLTTESATPARKDVTPSIASSESADNSAAYEVQVDAKHITLCAPIDKSPVEGIKVDDETILVDLPTNENPPKEIKVDQDSIECSKPADSAEQQTQIDVKAVTHSQPAPKEVEHNTEPNRLTSPPAHENPLKQQEVREDVAENESKAADTPTTVCETTAKTLPQESRDFASSIAPYKAPQPKKERITLPLKKQMSKLKNFEAAEANTEHLPATMEVRGAVELQPSAEPTTDSSIAKNVSVETSTLLDILKTVQLNQESAAAKASLATAERNAVVAAVAPADEPFTTATAIQSEAEVVAEKTEIQQAESVKSVEPFEAASDCSNSKTEDAEAKRSPARTDATSPQTIKKVTRRYERRQRRGDEPAHKTLEETFAEIAAQSSKEILELQYKELYSYEEEKNKANSMAAKVGAEPESPSPSKVPGDVADGKQTIAAAVQREDSAFALKTVSQSAVETALLSDMIANAENTIGAAGDAFGSDELPVREINDIPTSGAEVNAGIVDTAHVAAGEKHVANEVPAAFKDQFEIPIEAMLPLSQATDVATAVSDTSQSQERQTTAITVEQAAGSTGYTPGSARRGRKPKTKSAECKANADVEERDSKALEAEKQAGAEETATKMEVQPEKPRKAKKAKSAKEECVERAAVVTAPEMLETEPPVACILTADAAAVAKEEAMCSKEERTPKPPKKRLLKLQMELEQKAEQTVVSSHLAVCSPTETKANVAKKHTVESAKEVSSKKCKKSSNSSAESKDIAKTEERTERSTDEDSRSASSTPAVKRGKHKQKADTAAAEQPAASGKKKHRKTIEQSKLKTEKSSPSPNPKNQSDKSEKDRSTAAATSKKSEKKKFLEMEEAAALEQNKQLEEKSAKKKRQKKLKEAFEAALTEDRSKTNADVASQAGEACDLVKSDIGTPELLSPVHVLPLTPTELDVMPKADIETAPIESIATATAINEPDEDPDPLKDIEKFIEDGVNLLKRDYKLDDDSVDEVIHPKTVIEGDARKQHIESNEAADKALNSAKSEGRGVENLSTVSSTMTDLHMSEESKLVLQESLYETPADTPVATPTATPPPKSPVMDVTADEIAGVRRSHRIKLFTKTPKALVGRGLVRDKERFSLKDDIETKTHYSLDDHLMDLAAVEAKNAKFLKDMEERLSNFQVIKENEYKCERIVSREARKMICDCFLTTEEEERGELGCGEDCLNRLLMIECGPDCNVKDRCTNKRFQKFLCSPCRVFRTEKKGFGIMADIEILPGEFIMEYVGEVIDGDEFERRRTAYSQEKNRHYYFMALRSDAIIDATIKGNISRFINHSCDPNAETQKWTVNGELRIGFFSRKSIMPGEEITFDYQYQRYGREAQRCYCESANCRGWIGEEPNSDEGEQVDEDSDVDNLAEGLLDSDEDDSDESVTDAEEVKKKLEIAAAEAKLTPIGEECKTKIDDKADASRDKKKKLLAGDEERRESEEDSKSKFKKLLSKMAEKVAKKKNLTQKEKKQRKRRVQSPSKVSTTKSRYLEDPDIEDEVRFLSRCGLKNQSDTLRLSRLMVRAKLPQTRLNLLQILRNGELPCRRLFLDYHGMRLLHGWMSEDGGDMNIRLALLETLECLPIANKTVLTDSKVYQSVRNWCGKGGAGIVGNTSATGRSSLSPSDESSKESSSSNSQQEPAVAQEVPSELQKLASRLTAAWDSLPEIFRIPKRERIEQMKEHEREADRQYAAAAEDSNRSQSSDRYQRDRFGRSVGNRYGKPYGSKDARNITIVGATASSDPRRRAGVDGGSYASMSDSARHLSKEQRREMFAAKVARDEAEKRLAEERREFETKCRFFGLDLKKTRPQEVPFCVNPATGQWYSVERQPIATPPSYAHVQVHVKPKSTDAADYQLPAAVASLPPRWKFAITPQGNIYYYHVQYRVPQWEPPSPAQLAADGQTGTTGSGSDSDGAANDSTDDDDEVLLGMDQAQLKAYIEKKVEGRRKKRYNHLVDERPISPRREEDRMYNQLEVRKYKENKEKIRKRKEEIRRRRAEALKSAANMGMDESAAADSAQASKAGNDSDDELSGALPIQDYLLSSDEEDVIKAECNNSPLIDKIVQGDKIVDELDALKTNRTLKRPLPPHRDLSTQASGSSSGSGAGSSDKYEHKKRKLDKKEKSKKSKDSDSKYRRLKEKFRCEIAGIIVQHLKPYRKDSCPMGRIRSDEDFNHLARKLTHFVMIKELKYCESVGQTLVVTESVKNKSREFIKKYMAKYAGVYVKPTHDPEFKEIPFSL